LQTQKTAIICRPSSCQSLFQITFCELPFCCQSLSCFQTLLPNVDRVCRLHFSHTQLSSTAPSLYLNYSIVCHLVAQISTLICSTFLSLMKNLAFVCGHVLPLLLSPRLFHISNSKSFLVVLLICSLFVSFLIYRPKSSDAGDVKDRLLQILLSHYYGMLANGACSLTQVRLLLLYLVHLNLICVRQSSPSPCRRSSSLYLYTLTLSKPFTSFHEICIEHEIDLLVDQTPNC
jgi:hypothetical protein